MKRTHFRLLGAFVGFAVFLFGPFPALAQVAPDLKSAATYAVLGTNAIPTSGTVTCTDDGPGAIINGNVGTTGASITINGPCIITGSTDLSLPLIGPGVVTDFRNAYTQVDVLNPDSACLAMPTVSGSVAPGVYCSAASTTLGTGVILTLNGSASDVWVFKIGALGGAGALTLTDFQMVMGPGAQACNVYWRTAAAATMTRSIVVGTILSGGAISETGGSLLGRALATTDVTLTDPSPLTFAGCAAPATITVNKDFIPNNAATVPVALNCTSGTVTASPLNAAEGAPAVFTVTGALAGATCTATETVPVGYTANQANCVGVALGGSCTITNALRPTLTLRKTWAANSIAGNTVTVTSSGFAFNATSGLSTATSAGITTTGLPAPVTVGEKGTISEAFGVGSAAYYTTTLACTGNNTPLAGLAGNELTVNAADGAIVCTETNTLIPCPSITLTPATLSGILQGAAFSQTITVVGGGGRAYDFARTAGALPAGLALTGATNTSVNITGTPTTAGSFSFEITATDRLNPLCFSRITYTAVVGPGAAGGPTLDSLGLTILVLLLAAAGAFVVNRFSL